MVSSSLKSGEFLEKRLAECVKGRVSNRTLQSYRGNVDRYLVPQLGSYPLRRLTAIHVGQMESALLQGGGRNGKPLSSGTVLQAHRVLSKAMKDAVRLHLMPRNVAEDVNLSNGALSVQRALIKLPSGGMELNTPKNGQGRVLGLQDESVELLNLIYQRKCKVLENGNFVFCLPDGSTLDPDQVTQTFKRIAIKAGLAKFRFHDLRHTHASLMLSKGIHLKIVSERLGHSSIAITADLYSHVLTSVHRDTVSQFGSEWRRRNGKFRLGQVKSSKFVSGEWMGPGGPCGLQNRYASLEAG